MPRPKVPLLSRSKIVDAALELMDEVGAEEFSIHKLAKRLDVRPPSIYYYFADRDDLLSAVGLYVLQDVSYPETRSPDWATAMVDDAIAYFRAVSAHPHVTGILLERSWRRGAGARFNAVLEQLAEIGIPPVEGLALVDAIEGVALSWLAFRLAPAGEEPSGHPALDEAQRGLRYDEAAYRRIVVTLVDGARKWARPS